MFVDANDIFTQLDSLGRRLRWKAIDFATGLEVPHVICCDDVKGVLTRIVRDQAGNVLLNATRGGVRLVTESGQYKLIGSAR
tara:strand:+ start:6391 stop:6636 length:246 start_codon:yes stop_codon:yes gene_type:complete